MLLSEVQSILAALLTLVLGVYNALPIGDSPTDAPAKQRVEQSTTGAPSPVLASYSQVETQPGPDTGLDDKKPSTALSEILPTDSTRTLARSVANSPSVNAGYSAGYNPEYSGEAIDYLTKVGFGVEYGHSSSVLHRWGEDIRIRVHGEPTDADLATLQDVIQELNNLSPGLKLTATRRDANVDIHFIPESRFTTMDPKYVPVNLGFFRAWWDGDGVIYRGKILIPSQGITQQERSHLIREELTQSLGLFRDSWQYQDSIFYQGWTSAEEYSPLDRQIIGMLYSPQVEPGMDRGQVLRAFSSD